MDNLGMPQAHSIVSLPLHHQLVQTGQDKHQYASAGEARNHVCNKLPPQAPSLPLLKHTWASAERPDTGTLLSMNLGHKPSRYEHSSQGRYL